MSDDFNENKETGLLNTPINDPMLDRKPRMNTTVFGDSSKLKVTIGEKEIILDIKESMIVGRSLEENAAEGYALDLSDHDGYQGGVSRRHAIITQHNGSLYIEDLGSTNGTRINSFQLTARRKYRLRDGDELEFGKIRAVFHFISE